MTLEGYSRVYRFRLGYDLLLRRIQPRACPADDDLDTEVDTTSYMYHNALEHTVFLLWMPFGLHPTQTQRTDLRRLYNFDDESLLVQLTELSEQARVQRRAARDARLRDREERDDRQPVRRVSAEERETRRLARAGVAATRRANDPPQLNPDWRRPDETMGDDDIESLGMAEDEDGNMVFEPRRPRRGQAVEQVMPEEYETDDLAELIAEKPKKGKSKVKGMPEPPKPAKPKHKRRLVVRRKRPPVPED